MSNTHPLPLDTSRCLQPCGLRDKCRRAELQDGGHYWVANLWEPDEKGDCLNRIPTTEGD